MRRRLVAVALLAACACASAATSQPIAASASPAGGVQPTPSASPAQAANASKPALVGSSVYIYSFLDFREAEFSPELLDEIDERLEAALRARGTVSTVLRFKNSTIGAMYYPRRVRPVFGRSSESDQVPVDETIGENEAAERAFHPKYRLVEFPDDFQVWQAGWRRFTIRWILIDCSTGEVVLNHAYTGRNFIWLSNGERSESRGKTIVDALMSTLHNYKLL
jgi:hypothetical protein